MSLSRASMLALVVVAAVALLASTSVSAQTCLNEKGAPVDWFIMLKVRQCAAVLLLAGTQRRILIVLSLSLCCWPLSRCQRTSSPPTRPSPPVTRICTLTLPLGPRTTPLHSGRILVTKSPTLRTLLPAHCSRFTTVLLLLTTDTLCITTNCLTTVLPLNRTVIRRVK